MLKYLLGIKGNRLLNQDHVASMVNPYIDRSQKPRLIEPPSAELKAIQKKLKTLLGRIEVPDNVFSGIKGRSYVDNARYHTGEHVRYLFKIDFTAFFPSISRDTVYQFFLEDLQCAPDIAQILTNLTTIDLTRTSSNGLDDIYAFLSAKRVKCTNHLISGAPTSQIMSYLVNNRMFDEMQAVADQYNAAMSIYVDDVTFSSERRLPKRFKESILKVIKKYKYQVSQNKVKSYTRTYPKLITGVIIDPNGRLTIKNSLRRKIVVEHKYLREKPEDTQSRQRLRGLLTAARQVNGTAYPSIYQFAFSNSSCENAI